MDLCNKKEWVLTSVYGPTNSTRRGLFWAELNNVAYKWGKPGVVGAYFNVVRFATDRNREGAGTSSMRDFSDWIHHHDLIDLPPSRSTFSWSNNQVSLL